MNRTSHIMLRLKYIAPYICVAVYLFSSCIGEEFLTPGIDRELSFEASTGMTTTKAAPGNPLNTTADLQEFGHFYVSAFTPKEQLLSEQRVTWNGVQWELPHKLAYPSDSTSYFAYTNWQNAQYSSFQITSKGFKVNRLTVMPDELNSGGHHDMLLAASRGPSANRRVHLHFRHPLTKITFRAGNIAPRMIDVVITEVKICNVSESGDLSFPDAKGNATWSNLSDKTASYDLQGLATNGEDVSQGFVVPDLSATPTDYARFAFIRNNPLIDNTMLLIPQQFDPWDPKGDEEAPEQMNAYVRLRILIKRAGVKPTDKNAHQFVYAGAVDVANNRFLPTYAYAPLASLPKKTGQWEAGKQINYILNFGDNFTPSGGGGYDKEGKPILLPIRISLPIIAVVDDWLNAFVPLITISYQTQ